MHKSKLLELIKTFDFKERKDLQVFIRCYNRVDSYSIVLLEYILKMVPNFESKKLSKEEAFKSVFPKKTDYSDLVMRRCMSRLFRLCEEYIVFLNTKSYRHTRRVQLLDFYETHQLSNHFDNALQRWSKKLGEEPLIDDWHFFYEFQVSKEGFYHSYIEQSPKGESHLLEISDSLDSFFLMNKLKICCTSITYQTLNNTEYELPMIGEVLTYLEKKWERCSPIVQAYYFALLSLIDETEEDHFEKLKATIFKSINEFHPENQRDLFSFAQNYCIKRINKGDKPYLSELLEFYKIGLETEAVLENGILSPLDYKNIVTLGTRIKAYDWTEQFIEEYCHKLEEPFRESTYHYNLAHLFFSKKEYNEVIGLLHQVEHRELFVDLAVKVLLLKTYYELEEVEALISLTESFRMFLSRKKKLGYHKNRYQNFLKFLRHLMRLQVANDSEIEAFRKLVHKTTGLIEKDWFLEKIQ